MSVRGKRRTGHCFAHSGITLRSRTFVWRSIRANRWGIAGSMRKLSARWESVGKRDRAAAQRHQAPIRMGCPLNSGVAAVNNPTLAPLTPGPFNSSFNSYTSAKVVRLVLMRPRQGSEGGLS